MRRILAVAALAAGVSAGGAALAEERSVTCRSEGHREAVCRIHRDAAEVELRRRISDSDCVHGRSWGVRRGAIWVDRGCAAVFAVYVPDAARPRDGERVACRSESYRYNECRIDARAREVEMVRRISEAPCVHGRSWGFEPGRLWVDKGCAGVFEVSTRASGRGGPRRRWDGDRGRPGLDRLFAERAAIRACRRFGEDHPGRLGANWADAAPHESFRATGRGRGEGAWTVAGRFKIFTRGRESTAGARCAVRDGRVIRFDRN